MNKNNRDKQLLFIAKLENELKKAGFGEGALNALKSKYTLHENNRTGYSRMSRL